MIPLLTSGRGGIGRRLHRRWRIVVAVVRGGGAAKLEGGREVAGELGGAVESNGELCPALL